MSIAGPCSQSVLVVAGAIGRLPPDRRTLVAIDGVDGAGKTTFADLLAPALKRPAVRASCDDFHHPKARRYARGNDSPEGFYLDSFDYDSLETLLLAPYAAGEPFTCRAFDHRSDRPVDGERRDAPPDAVLIFDGMFLHRDRLRQWWDLSVLLDVPRQTAESRLLQREGQERRDRYTKGQDLYFAEAGPAAHASLVVRW